MSYFDIHSHLNDERFLNDLSAVLARMREHSIKTIVVGTDKEMSARAVSLAEEHSDIYASIGLHPRDNIKEAFEEAWYDRMLQKEKTVAMGECGLDFFRLPAGEKESEWKRQRDIFEKQIYLAAKHKKPLMIHCRQAHREMLDILASKKRELGDSLVGNIHFFSEGIETAKKYFDLNFTISFTGVITFASDYNEAVREAPLTQILSETDCPYVAPVPHRGKRNEPAYIIEIVKRIATIRRENFNDVSATLYQNALRVFHIQ